MTIEKGDVVKLDADGRVMLVAGEDEGGVRCHWCEGTELREQVFPAEQLRRLRECPVEC
jgi:uncharacterized protein YodC (DUF2158 family)